MRSPVSGVLGILPASAGQRPHALPAQPEHGGARRLQPFPEPLRARQAPDRSGQGAYDLISTHHKYAPSQKHFLRPLDDWFLQTELGEFLPSVLEMSRVDGWLLSLPRNIDVRLLHYRRDLFEDPSEQAEFRQAVGRDLRVPDTWEELAQVASFFTRPPDLYGFAFPGRDSGLFGTFFELVAMAGGKLFRADLRPGFVDTAGRWALGYLRRLYAEAKVTPPELPHMRYDEVSGIFLEGRCAMITDWPGTFYRYRDPAQSRIAGHFHVALYPTGPAAQRWVYAGGHAFAVPTSVRDEEGAKALLKFLTSVDAQWHEAQHGALPVLKSVQNRLKAETDAASLEGQRLQMLEETVNSHMLLPPRLPQYPAMEKVLWQSLQKGLTGEWSVEDALHHAAGEWEKWIA